MRYHSGGGGLGSGSRGRLSFLPCPVSFWNDVNGVKVFAGMEDL